MQFFLPWPSEFWGSKREAPSPGKTGTLEEERARRSCFVDFCLSQTLVGLTWFCEIYHSLNFPTFQVSKLANYSCHLHPFFSPHQTPRQRLGAAGPGGGFTVNSVILSWACWQLVSSLRALHWDFACLWGGARTNGMQLASPQ